MKHLFFCLIFNCAGLLLSAQSANFQPHTQIDNAFIGETLSLERLQGFEFKAQQKIKEFANLMAMASNPDYAAALRQKAAKMGIALFDKPSNWVSGIGCSGKCTAQSLFDDLLQAKTAVVWTAQDIKTQKPLNRQSERYSGSLRFSQGGNASENLVYEVGVLLIKVEKQFGNTTEAVWEVRLTDIKRL